MALNKVWKQDPKGRTDQQGGMLGSVVKARELNCVRVQRPRGEVTLATLSSRLQQQ